jgi:hypothetical protein
VTDLWLVFQEEAASLLTSDFNAIGLMINRSIGLSVCIMWFQYVVQMVPLQAVYVPVSSECEFFTSTSKKSPKNVHLSKTFILAESFYSEYSLKPSHLRINPYNGCV